MRHICYIALLLLAGCSTPPSPSLYENPVQRMVPPMAATVVTKTNDAGCYIIPVGRNLFTNCVAKPSTNFTVTVLWDNPRWTYPMRVEASNDLQHWTTIHQFNDAHSGDKVTFATSQSKQFFRTAWP
jgi:hypothetical protein